MIVAAALSAITYLLVGLALLAAYLSVGLTVQVRSASAESEKTPRTG